MFREKPYQISDLGGLNLQNYPQLEKDIIEFNAILSVSKDEIATLTSDLQAAKENQDLGLSLIELERISSQVKMLMDTIKELSTKLAHLKELIDKVIDPRMESTTEARFDKFLDTLSNLNLKLTNLRYLGIPMLHHQEK